MTNDVFEFCRTGEPSIDIADPDHPGVIFEMAARGPTGPAGDPGAIITLPANGPLEGHRVVIGDGAGGAAYADSSNPVHLGRVIGITAGAVDDGQQVMIQISQTMTDSSWTWSPGDVYLGTNGMLTQLVPAVGFEQVVGSALSPTQISISIHRPVLII